MLLVIVTVAKVYDMEDTKSKRGSAQLTMSHMVADTPDPTAVNNGISNPRDEHQNLILKASDKNIYMSTVDGRNL